MDYRVNGEGDVIIVRWLDNGVVQLVSTLLGTEPMGTVKRWSDRIQQHIELMMLQLPKDSTLDDP